MVNRHRLVRLVFHPDPRLRLPAPPHLRRARGRYHALSGARCQGAVGADDLRLLHLTRPSPADAGHSRIRRAQLAVDRFSGARRAVERCFSVRLGQAVRQAQAVAGNFPVENAGRAGRRRTQFNPGWRGALVDHAFRSLAGGPRRADHQRPRLLRRFRAVRHQTRPRPQGLGRHDRRPRRHARPRRFDQLLGADFLPHRALLVGVN